MKLKNSGKVKQMLNSKACFAFMSGTPFQSDNTSVLTLPERAKGN